MDLTERRRQFLSRLIQLYRKSGTPVHYEELARSLEVSKWTAYEVIKALRKAGLAEPVYEGNDTRSGPGRWRVCFLPTAKALSEFPNHVVSAVREEWLRAEERLLAQIRSAYESDSSTALRSLAVEMDNASDPVIWCAHGMIYLMVAGLHHSRRALALGIRMLQSAPVPLAGLLMYASSLGGALIQTGTPAVERVATKIPVLLPSIGDEGVGWLAGLVRKAAGELKPISSA